MRKVLSCAAILFAVATAACAETSNAQSHVQFAVAGEVGARAPRVVEEHVVSTHPKMLEAGKTVPIYMPLVMQRVAVGNGRSLVVWNDDATDSLMARITEADGSSGEPVRLSAKTAIGSPRVERRGDDKGDVLVTFFAATEDGFEQVATLVDPNP
jgi:hypothetical protein